MEIYFHFHSSHINFHEAFQDDNDTASQNKTAYNNREQSKKKRKNVDHKTKKKKLFYFPHSSWLNYGH